MYLYCVNIYSCGFTDTVKNIILKMVKIRVISFKITNDIKHIDALLNMLICGPILPRLILHFMMELLYFRTTLRYFFCNI